MDTTDISFIGCGNMATSIISGLISNGYPAHQLHVADTNPAQLAAIHQRHQGIQRYSDNTTAIIHSNTIILAIKPQQAQTVLSELASQWQPHQLCISVMAGIELDAITTWLNNPRLAAIRVMPNTPAMLNLGASGLYANAYSNEQQRQQAMTIMQTCGIAIWLAEEQDIDAVTALSGSGPAYFFFMMEAMIEAAVSLGLTTDIARQLCHQTAIGAATMAHQSRFDINTLRQQVTSPGGTTAHAIEVLQSNDFKQLITKAMQAAATRSKELAKR